MSIPASRLGPIGRRVLPSLTDLLFAVLLFARFGRGLFSDGDSGWHLWAGFDVWSHGPRWIPDALSFTRAGVPWRDVQWLGDALLAAAYHHAGYFGVCLFVGLVHATLWTWVYRRLFHATGHAPAALLAAALAGLVCLMQLLARPVVFSFVMAVLAWELVRAAGRERRAAILLPLVTALWANLHPTAFVAPLLGAWAWASRGRPRALLAATLLSALALGATPWGFGWLAELAPTHASLSLLGRIDEWQAPRFSDPRFAFLLVTVLVSVAARRYGPRLTRGEAVLGLGCLAGALLVVRVAPFGVILWAPYLARDLAAWARGTGGGVPGRIWRAMQESLAPFEHAFRPGLWPAALAALLLVVAPRIGPVFPTAHAGFPADAFPRAALAAAERESLGPRLVNEYGWGGYVSWAGRGRWKTFVDGRAGFFAGDVIDDYFRVFELQPGWADTLARWRPDWLLVHTGSPVIAAAPLTGRWRIAYQDSIATILAPTAREASAIAQTAPPPAHEVAPTPPRAFARRQPSVDLAQR